MSFAAFCLCHALDAAIRWDALEQFLLRRRLALEREARRARIIDGALAPGDEW